MGLLITEITMKVKHAVGMQSLKGLLELGLLVGSLPIRCWSSILPQQPCCHSRRNSRSSAAASAQARAASKVSRLRAHCQLVPAVVAAPDAPAGRSWDARASHRGSVSHPLLEAIQTDGSVRVRLTELHQC